MTHLLRKERAHAARAVLLASGAAGLVAGIALGARIGGGCGHDHDHDHHDDHGDLPATWRIRIPAGWRPGCAGVLCAHDAAV
jgi:hypothetical protein